MASDRGGDWVSQLAGQVIARAAGRTSGQPIVCASGISASGPIHLGSLREVMMPHLVADELRRRGHDCVHLLSWDDYDRFRKVPAGVNASWAEHIGKPLSSVPAPPGSAHDSWAEHFKAPMQQALDQLGIEVRGISQTEQYTSGAYREQVLLAMRERHRIDAVLRRYRTKASPAVSQRPLKDADDAEAARDAAQGSGAASEDDGAAAGGYYPYKPYCSVCNRDLTTVTAYDDASTALSYTCACGHAETVLLSEHDRGKLVWKVDWPMRWAYEEVDFEPSGVDHTSPGSSFVVGSQIISEVFGAQPPIGPMYAFVGISGMAKMSSSRGGVPTPSDALQVMEAPLLRWMYARRKPQQSFTIAFDQEIQRLYDEWDALGRKIGTGTAAEAEATAYDRAVRTAASSLPSTPRPLPYRLLASIVDITTGDDEQVLRILREIDTDDPVTSLEQTQPRLDKAAYWVRTQLPEQLRTHVREEPDTGLLASLGPTERESLELLLAGLDDDWSLSGLTTLLYGVPKQQAGLGMDAKPTPGLKLAQRTFFALLYRLLVGRDTGPRLPTLLLAVGADRVRRLLGR